MRTALLFATIALASLANAQFSSGFESWNDTVPADWMGNKTTISADSVEQVSTNVHGGSYAVRLRNAPSGHKRFTTQPTAVTNGTIYTISFWVRGTGNIRTGLYDGRTAGSGYANYNAYFNSTGNTWTQVSQSIACAHDTSDGEFILSVQLTSGPEALVVDDVNITGGGAATDASIYEIQYSTLPDSASSLANQIVLTGGIVTGVDTIGTGHSYFIQSGTGPWSGVYVFDGVSTVNIGDSVTMQATVQEYFTTTELGAVGDLTIAGQYPVPAPEALATNAVGQEQWEGVLVHVTNATCSSGLDGFNQWTVNDGSGSLLVDDLMYLFTPTVGTHYDITGIAHFANDEWKLEPRMPSDINIANSVSENDAAAMISIYPNPANDVLMVNIAQGASGNWTITDATGRAVLAGSLNSERSAISVSALVPGAYTLTLRNATSARSTPLHIVR